MLFSVSPCKEATHIFLDRGSISLGDFILMQSGSDIIHYILPGACVIIQAGFYKKLFYNRDIKLNRALLSAGCCEVYDVPLHDVLGSGSENL